MTSGEGEAAGTDELLRKMFPVHDCSLRNKVQKVEVVLNLKQNTLSEMAMSIRNCLLVRCMNYFPDKCWKARHVKHSVDSTKVPKTAFSLDLQAPDFLIVYYP